MKGQDAGERNTDTHEADAPDHVHETSVSRGPATMKWDESGPVLAAIGGPLLLLIFLVLVSILKQ